jgi:hypothetical protein
MGKRTPILSAKAAASNETKINETKNKKQDTGDEPDVKIDLGYRIPCQRCKFDRCVCLRHLQSFRDGLLSLLEILRQVPVLSKSLEEKLGTLRTARLGHVRVME